jgi:hypothetical protein
MSYFNQPDHELIDRRDEQVRGLLLRLARSTTMQMDAEEERSGQPSVSAATSTAAFDRWLALARERGLPNQDAEPLTVGDVVVPLVWRAHYVTATIDDLSTETKTALEDSGFEIVAFTASEPDWSAAFSRLVVALGVTNDSSRV